MNAKQVAAHIEDEKNLSTYTKDIIEKIKVVMWKKGRELIETFSTCPWLYGCYWDDNVLKELERLEYKVEIIPARFKKTWFGLGKKAKTRSEQIKISW
jgi:hypothetical protein